MKRIILATACAALFSAPALADHGHNHGEKAEKYDEHGMDHDAMEAGTTMPADGEVVTGSPEHLMIQFGHAMNVESLTLTTLTGEVIDVDVSAVGKTAHLMVDLPELQADDYSADWRATGDDGHVMSGSFSFTVE
ncbi:MAG: copper resistance CopC family protein [Pseudomonadota bacterium]